MPERSDVIACTLLAVTLSDSSSPVSVNTEGYTTDASSGEQSTVTAYRGSLASVRIMSKKKEEEKVEQETLQVQGGSNAERTADP